MNAQQIQQEMQRLQTEIMQIQAKYMSGAPTQEDYAKMNEEMEPLTRQMTDLSMQYASAAMAETYGPDNAAANAAMANAYAEAGAYTNQFAADPMGALKEMFGDNTETKRKFVEQHPVAPDKEKYLPVGALLLATHEEPWQTFASMADDDDWREMLKEGWEIEKASEGREMLTSLLDGRHTRRYGGDYKKFKAGQPHKLDDDSVEGYNETMDSIAEDIAGLLPAAQKCDNILAWDLERVGYLARIYYNIGWIDENELLDWLGKTAGKIKDAFSSWDAYIASILIGRAVCYSYDYDVILTARDVLTEGKEFLAAHPVSDL